MAPYLRLKGVVKRQNPPEFLDRPRDNPLFHAAKGAKQEKILFPGEVIEEPAVM